jgi:hypothetical protein
VVGVGEPGGEREPDVGDAVDGIQAGEILDLDAARPELGDLYSPPAPPAGRKTSSPRYPGKALAAPLMPARNSS